MKLGDMAVVVRAMGHPGISEETGQVREENKSRQAWLVGNQSHSDKRRRKLQNRLRYGQNIPDRTEQYGSLCNQGGLGVSVPRAFSH